MTENFSGFHHAYIGLALLIAGFLVIFKKRKKLALFLLVLGSLILSDDCYQHIRQIDDPGYRSPLNRAYTETLGKIDVVQDVNKIVDKIFGI